MRQLRGDIAPGRVQLHVANDSDAAVALGILTLTSPVLATAATTSDDDGVLLAPGRSVNLPVVLPDRVCGEAGAAVVTGSVDAGSGPASFRVAAADPLDALARLGAQQCDVERIARVASISAGGVTAADDGTAVLALRIDPVADGDGSLELVALRGTPLLRFAAGEEAALGIRVVAGDRPSAVPVAIVPRRCDPHALAEDKVGTLLGLVVEVGGEEVSVPLPRSQDVAEALLDYVGDACGLSG